jgi:hypothetical protein
MRSLVAAFAVLAVMLCCCCPDVLAAGIPVTTGGVIYANPVGDGPDGEPVDTFPALTITLDYQITSEPETIADPFTDFTQWAKDIAKFGLANMRFEGVVFEETTYTLTHVGANDMPDVYEEEKHTTGAVGVQLNLIEGNMPLKAGALWAPHTEWDVAWYAGLDLYNFSNSNDSAVFSFGPTYGSQGMGGQLTYQKEF